jgi:hypothetical protein
MRTLNKYEECDKTASEILVGDRCWLGYLGFVSVWLEKFQAIIIKI